MSRKSDSFFNRSMDLSQGNIFSQLMMFSLPLLAGQVFQTLYNSVDSIVIGRLESPEALAAVTASGTISMILSGFFNGVSAGASAYFARFFGAKDYQNLHDAIHTTVLFSAIFGLFLSILGILVSPLLLGITKCPPEIMEMSVTYLRVYLFGIFFTCLYNIAASVLRSIGDSNSPFVFLVISSVLNMVLDIAFVAWLHMGVAGVAVATVIAQGISMILAFWKMTRMDEQYRFCFSHLSIRWELLAGVARMGLPAGLQSSLQAVGALIVQSYTNSFSSYAIAGIGAGMRLDQFIGMPCNAFGLAMTTFIGQNIGAKKYGRTHKAVGIASLATAVYVVVFGLLMYFISDTMVSIFSTDPEVIYYGSGFLHVIMPVYIFMGVSMLFGGILRGYGYSITAMVCMLAGYLGARQIWLYVTINYIAHDVQFLYWCYPVGWGVAAALMVAIYLFVIRKKFREA